MFRSIFRRPARRRPRDLRPGSGRSAPVRSAPVRSARVLWIPALAATAATAAIAGPARAQTGSDRWPVRTAEHVDLWLHGLALVLDDTARVPLFARGYREAQRAERARGSVYTQLDAEMDRLRARVAANPRLGLDAQFVPLGFQSFEQIVHAVDALLQTEGDPRRVRDEETAVAVAGLAQAFPSAQDRDWLRIYTNALQDERDRYYHRRWTALQQERAGALAASDSVWQQVVRPRIQRFLSGSQQPGGTLLLSPVLGGEGRTRQGGRNDSRVAVPLPARPADAAEASYVAVHEFVGAIVGQVVADNTSPADQRAGIADRYVAAGQVRAGLLLLRKTAPALADGYARYYLQTAGVDDSRAARGGRGLAGPTPGAGSEPAPSAAQAALEAAFPLPAAMLDAIARQVDVVLGGI